MTGPERRALREELDAELGVNDEELAVGLYAIAASVRNEDPLREVALEKGVDAKLYDQTIDLRKIARGNQASSSGGAASRSHEGVLVAPSRNRALQHRRPATPLIRSLPERRP